MESTVFRCGRGQGVYLPEAVALPDEVTHVEIVVVVRIPAKLNSHSGQREHPDP